ncbi:MAG: lysylphosphatidylglycerol synthase domain-containing protein [Gemmatimonadales bacterium]|nr:hypothetical protein [Gemmatimonadales bacterium]
MRDRLIRAARVLLAVVILAFVVRTFARNWDALRAEPIRWVFHPTPALGAVLLVWGMYAILIEAWRRMLAGWGDRLSYATASRIWVLSSLGKYVPGKVWAIAGMALMARDAGVSGWAATASAVILQVLAIGTGAVMAMGFGGAAVEATHPGVLRYFVAGAVLAAVALAALCSPSFVRRLLGIVGIQAEAATPGAAPVVMGVLANLAAWMGYGGSLWLLARATLPEGNLGLPLAVASFAASYVSGLVALIFPGGLVVREGVLVAMLQGPIGLGPATALAIASRVLLTITELGAAVPFLLLRPGKSRAA